MVNVGIISEFFFPRIGGVETHMYSIALCLNILGHKVTVITNRHTSGGFSGIRYINNGIKVYYLPLDGLIQNSLFPIFFSGISILLYNIVKREKI